MATKSAITPRLLPRELLPAAAALQGITVGIMVMAGPALAGRPRGLRGLRVDVHDRRRPDALAVPGTVDAAQHPARGRASCGPGLDSLRDGWQFLRRASNIRLQYILDIIAMTFGQPLALFPAIGAMLLGGGPITTGVLTAAFAVGAFFSSLFSGPIGRVRHHGLGIERAIMRLRRVHRRVRARAAGRRVRACSRPPPSTPPMPMSRSSRSAGVFLVVAGGADNVSAIYRSTMMQSAVPDSMRGRLQGIFIVVVTGGPRIGALYAGVLATLTTLWFPPLLGGFVIIGLVALLVRRSPRFRAYDAEHPVP